MKEIQQLEIFIRTYYSFMCATAFHFIGSQDLAQDITQEVIIKFWQNKEDLEIRFIENHIFYPIYNTFFISRLKPFEFKEGPILCQEFRFSLNEG